MRGAAQTAILALAAVACDSNGGSQAAGPAPATLGDTAAADPGAIPAAERAAIPGEIVFAAEHRHHDADHHHHVVEMKAILPSGEGLRRLAGGEDASFYPAAGGPLSAVVLRGLDHEQLVLLDAEGAPRPLGPVSARTRNPSWAPDGAWVVFESDRESFRDVYRIEVATGAMTRLTDDPEGNYEPAVSPDGARIAFVSSRDGNAEVYMMRADGSEQDRLTAFHFDSWSPVWSPDGETLAFLSDRTGSARIFLMRPDGTGQRELNRREHPDDNEQDLAWSPDGTRIAHVSRIGAGASRVWVTDLATGARTPLSPADASASNPVWSPDGRYLAFSMRRARARGTHLHLVRADGSGLTQLTDGHEAHWLPRWRP
jgi:TolB protein